MKPTILLVLLLILFNPIKTTAETLQIDGRVMELQNQTLIVGAEIVQNDKGSITDAAGRFEITANQGDTLLIRMMGYESQYTAVISEKLDVYLTPIILQGQSIDVTASRVIPGITPVAYSTLRKSDIDLHYTTEDVPMVLSSAPGVHAYSESGNGTGYSYVSIRGFDQSRIAVMLDNVPLNDNESHQVYWVDHGDILSDAADVEIQRGVGNSLYGATAFGGSININTQIKYEQESVDLKVLAGSYDTRKVRLAYRSGKRFGDNMSFSIRGTILDSDGYRDDSASKQRSLMAGLEHRSGAWTNQLRVTIGKEISVLQWDGVTIDMLNDVDQRRSKLPWTVPFTDDFLQEIYSLNSSYLINDHSVIRNVVYLVKGDGFYQVQKYGVDYFQYNLDPDNHYTDAEEMSMETDLMRKKWIQNLYYGFVPVWTYETSRWRSDLGLEYRHYSGDHFGEVSEASDSLLSLQLPETYRYYDYRGEKQLTTLFAHILSRMSPKLTLVGDLQTQFIDWNLFQELIGHAPGVDLSADWQFVNPRLGLSYAFTGGLNLFAGIGRAQKEPADAQIIEADDVWSTPIDAPVEGVISYELGLNWFTGKSHLNVNLYRIDFENEVIQDIYDFEAGQFTIESADRTIHQGLEFDLGTQWNRQLNIGLNGSLAAFTFSGGEMDGRLLTNVPSTLANFTADYSMNSSFRMGLILKHVGAQFIDHDNTAALEIDGYQLLNLTAAYHVGDLSLNMRANNVLDTKYATFGYAWGAGYYWPGATRNYSLGLNYSFQ